MPRTDVRCAPSTCLQILLNAVRLAKNSKFHAQMCWAWSLPHGWTCPTVEWVPGLDWIECLAFLGQDFAVSWQPAIKCLSLLGARSLIQDHIEYPWFWSQTCHKHQCTTKEGCPCSLQNMVWWIQQVDSLLISQMWTYVQHMWPISIWTTKILHRILVLTEAAQQNSAHVNHATASLIAVEWLCSCRSSERTW
jgi:hypothetical protein